MFKLLGYERKTGEFTNKETGEVVKYDNYELYFGCDEKQDVKGLYCDSARAKADTLSVVGAQDLDEAIGKEVLLISDLTAKPDENGRVRLNVGKVYVVK